MAGGEGCIKCGQNIPIISAIIPPNRDPITPVMSELTRYRSASSKGDSQALSERPPSVCVQVIVSSVYSNNNKEKVTFSASVGLYSL